MIRLTWDEATVHYERTLRRTRLALRAARLNLLTRVDDIVPSSRPTRTPRRS